ncbi:uncharacterized protein LY89DRAFT_603076 [Mollisia scopiformis]|uniref:Zn(2)-C6 fungal-type domain-containing protein n=1 Tax=Mollisia scopiformis TaxID=149040 RepID=A0A132B2G4_MOLSC|nr:uncharacterized protein LY89DRAFT_603076 [Mollisia scopiformis]KUJ06576.1 hypothetical protein LY89DRAFT_603076 [Mollisia scopiformis]
MDASYRRRSRGAGIVTPNACTECRRKRAKCDGQKPCTRCASQLADCIYEAPARQTKDEMRSEIRRLQEYQRQSKMMLEALASDGGAGDVLQMLKKGEAVEDISRRLEASKLPEASSTPSTTATKNGNLTSSIHQLPFEFEDWLEQWARANLLESAFRHEQGSRRPSQELLLDHSPTDYLETWTTVTSDRTLVEHLLALYFCWEYPIFATIKQEQFMLHFFTGNPRYCSSLLVNALLALACRFSERAGNNLGDAFFAEATRLINTEKRHALTTVQALGVMSIREASCGRINESVFLSGQSISLAIEMGLHVETDSEDEPVREATFWGAFSLNKMLSLVTCSLPQTSYQIPLPAKPAIIDRDEQSLWVPYTDYGEPLGLQFGQPSNLRSVYWTFCELSEKVYNALHILYSPVSGMNSAKLIELYKLYLEWYDTIPDSLRLGQNSTPSVLFAHLFYHSATLILFQPFIKLRLVSSSIVPLEVCLQAASAITGLVKSYSDLYTLRLTPSFVPYFVLQSSIIHLIAIKMDSSNIDARMKLEQGIRDLEAMGSCHGFALRAIEALSVLAVRWEVDVQFAQNESPNSDLMDYFSADVPTLGRVHSIGSDSEGEPFLFSPFPLQGLPCLGVGELLERDGFTMHTWI